MRGAEHGRTPSGDRKRLIRGAVTVAVLAGAYLGAYLIRFEFQVPASVVRLALLTLPVVVIGKLLLLRLLRTHRRSWRYTSLWDMLLIVQAMVAAALIILGVRLLSVELLVVLGRPAVAPIPLSVIVLDLLLSAVGLIGVRTLRRVYHEEQVTRRRRDGAQDGPHNRVLLVGAGQLGGQVAREILAHPQLGSRPVGFIDDNPFTHGQVVHGVEVLGDREDLPQIVADYAVDRAILTISDLHGQVVRDVTERLRALGVDVLVVPGVEAMLDGRVSLSRVRPVRIEDLLRREPVELDTSAIGALIAGRCVLVTGAGGSIGAELCRQLVRFAPGRLVLVDRAEPALWAIHRELEVQGVELVPAIADVCDAVRIDALLAAHHPTMVFHAAAHKHVPMMEVNPGEAVKNNVLGTMVVADAAARHDVERFVLISTDKAVNPSSVMGATKRAAERYVQGLAADTGRVFVSVRFGNVLGSTGSVVPIFEQQIADGGPVTVTHPEMTRYFMTIPEAAQLVVQAGAIGAGGEGFVLDMGEPVRIVDLARDLVRLSGMQPDVDIPITFTGIRPGEKLFEELALDCEHTDRTTHPSIMVSRTAGATWPERREQLAALAAAATQDDPQAVRAALVAAVPELSEPDRRPVPDTPRTAPGPVPEHEEYPPLVLPTSPSVEARP